MASARVSFKAAAAFAAAPRPLGMSSNLMGNVMETLTTGLNRTGKTWNFFSSPTSSAARAISGKALRLREPRPKPFNQDKYDFTALWALLDRTTLRFDENSKLVVVEGAHAVGKTKFAKELAEELEMLYMPNPAVTSMAVNAYGDDLRNYKEYFTPANWVFDETDFSRNPTGVVDGSCDRHHLRLYIEKFRTHLNALQHIFNTGACSCWPRASANLFVRKPQPCRFSVCIEAVEPMF